MPSKARLDNSNNTFSICIYRQVSLATDGRRSARELLIPSVGESLSLGAAGRRGRETGRRGGWGEKKRGEDFFSRTQHTYRLVVTPLSALAPWSHPPSREEEGREEERERTETGHERTRQEKYRTVPYPTLPSGVPVTVPRGFPGGPLRMAFSTNLSTRWQGGGTFLIPFYSGGLLRGL